MISVADCWSRMLSRFARVENDELVSDRTTNRIRNGDQDRSVRSRQSVGEPTPPSRGPSWPRRPRLGLAHRAQPPPVGERGAEDRALRDRVALELATMLPARITSTRWAEPDHLLELGRDQQDPEPVGGERSEEVVDRALRRRRRRRGSARRRSPPAAGRAASARAAPSAGCRPRAARPAPSSSRRARRSGRARRGRLPLAAAADEADGRQLVEPGERRVLDRRAAEDEAVVLARLGDHREARADAPARAAAQARVPSASTTSPDGRLGAAP